MQRKEFLDLVRSPFPVNEKSVEQVKEIIEEFPYFQTAQLLYAKLLKETNDIHYDSRLKIAAIYAADRKQLHHLIEKKFTDTIFESVYKIADHEQKAETKKPAPEITFFEKPQEIPAAINEVEEIQSTPSADEKNEPIEEVKQKLNTVSETEISAAKVTFFEKPQEIPAAINEVEEIQSTPSADKKNEPSVEEKQEFNSISETKLAVPEIENIPVPEPTLVFESEDKYKIEDFFAPEIIETEKSIVVEDIILPTHAVVNELPEEEIKIASEREIVAALPEQPEGKRSFLQWLSFKVPVTTPENRVKSNVAAIEQPIEEKPKPVPIEIIENFIKEEPRISPAKPGFFSPVNMARKSVEEHEDLVSPTLAKIYLMQGNAQKAVSTYEKLILLYPEKSTFFAAQIEKILNTP